MQLIVLGMHRSGTSMITRLLNMMGAYYAPEDKHIGFSEENMKGFWERQDVIDANDDLLNASGSSWCKVSNFVIDKISENDLLDYEHRIKKIIFNLDLSRPWVLKDPRMCLTFSLWRPLLEVPICILMYRNPIQVARSLQKRNGFPIKFGIALWERYTLDTLKSSIGLPRLLLSHDQLMKEPVETVNSIYEGLVSHNVQALRMPTKKEITSYIEMDYFKARGGGLEELKEHLNPELLNLFSALEDRSVLDWEEIPAISKESQTILEKFEDSAIASVKSELATWDQHDDGKDNRVERLTSEIKDRDSQINHLTSEMKDLQENLAESRSILIRKRIIYKEQISKYEKIIEDLKAKSQEEIETVKRQAFESVARLEIAVNEGINSSRWKIGNSIGQFLQVVTFRPQVPLWVDSAKIAFREFYERFGRDGSSGHLKRKDRDQK